jgi:hypothetical protein
MKLLLLLVLSSTAHAAPQFWNLPAEIASDSALIQSEVYDESINFQPGLNLYQEAATLTDLYGAHGSQLCGPISLTHVFNFLKYKHQPPFPQLKTFPDMDQDGVVNSYRDQIRFFFQTCKTNRDTGSFFREIVNCMRDYMNQSGVGTWAYMIGAHATEVPPQSTIDQVQHVLGIDDLRYFLGAQAGVVMGIGWYSYNATTQSYTREGGHLFAVYGYDYQKAWAKNQMVLDVVNSWMDYQSRTPNQMFDRVTMTALPADGTRYPVETGYELRGPGFNFTQRAFVEDIMVAYPVPPNVAAP